MSNVQGNGKADPTEVEALVRRQLESGTVWNARSDTDELDGLRRAIGDAGALRGAFAAAVAHLLEDADLKVRTGAVAVLSAVRGDLGPDHLANLLAQRPELFEGVAPKRYPLGAHKDLAGGVWAALGSQVQEDKRASDAVVPVLRRGAAAGRWVVAALAAADADWLVANAVAVVPRVSIGGVLQNLPTAEHRRKLLEALAPWPREDAQTQLSWDYWRYLPAGEVPALRAILERR